MWGLIPSRRLRTTEIDGYVTALEICDSLMTVLMTTPVVLIFILLQTYVKRINIQFSSVLQINYFSKNSKPLNSSQIIAFHLISSMIRIWKIQKLKKTHNWEQRTKYNIFILTHNLFHQNINSKLFMKSFENIFES